MYKKEASINNIAVNFLFPFFLLSLSRSLTLSFFVDEACFNSWKASFWNSSMAKPDQMNIAIMMRIAIYWEQKFMSNECVKQVSALTHNASHKRNTMRFKENQRILRNLQLWIAEEKSLLYEMRCLDSNGKCHVYICVIDWAFAFNLSLSRHIKYMRHWTRAPHYAYINRINIFCCKCESNSNHLCIKVY